MLSYVEVDFHIWYNTAIMRRITRKSKYYYPLTPQTINALFVNLFGPLANDQSSTYLITPNFGGGRALTKFMLQNLEKLARENNLPMCNLKNYIFIDTDELEEGNKISYFSLILKQLNKKFEQKKTKIPEDFDGILSSIHEKVKRITKKKQLVFVLRGINALDFADSYFYSNILSLKTCAQTPENPNPVNFLFIIYEDSPQKIAADKMEKLHEHLLQNVAQVESIITSKDIDYSIDRWEYILDRNFTTKERDAIKKVSTGAPAIMKFCCLHLDKNPDAKDPQTQLENDPLIRSQTRLRRKTKKSNLKIEPPDIYLDEQKITYAFTPAEHSVLSLLIEKKGEAVDKDNIAEAMWPGEALESYSEWAITQLIKRLRTKLNENFGLPSDIIKTVRGKGYILR